MNTELLLSPYGEIECIRFGDTRPQLLLLHGFGGSVKLYSKIIPILEKHHLSGIAMSYPYHGLSSILPKKPPAFSLNLFAHWVLDRMPSQINQICAHSMGTRLALQLATNEPKRYRGLHLVAPAGFYYMEHWMFKSFHSGMGQWLVKHAFPGNLIIKWLIPNADEDKLEYLRRLFGWYTKYYPEMDFDRLKIRHKFYLIKGLITIYGGKNDHLMPISQIRDAAQNFVNGKAELIDDCGHIPMLQQPERFSELLIRNITTSRQM